MFYPIQITKTPDGFRAASRDIPEFDFTEKTLEELQKTTQDGLPSVMVLCYRRKRKAIPMPSAPEPGESLVYVPVKLQAKILFWNYLVTNRYRIADLARELGVAHSEAGRLVNLEKDMASIDAIERALRKLGGSFSLTISK